MMSPWEVLWLLLGWGLLLIAVFLLSWILWCMLEAVVKHFKVKRKLPIEVFTARAMKAASEQYSLPLTDRSVLGFTDGARWARENRL